MKKSSFLRLGLFVFAVAFSVRAGDEFPQQPGQTVVANRLIIGFKSGVNPLSLIAPYLPNAVISPHNLPNVFVINAPNALAAGIATALSHLSSIVYVEPDRVRKAVASTPNDPNYSSSLQWGLFTVQAQQAWNLLGQPFLTSATAGTGRIKVAIIDTGADCTHPDFMNAGGSSTNSAAGGQMLWSASQAIVSTSVSSPTCPWQDDNGHGTHVSGIVAAATNNAVGIASLGYPLQLVEFKALDASGSGTDSGVANAIVAAANAGVQVISMSLGEAGYSQTLQSAVDYAWQHNVVVLAAAGNSSTSSLFFPGGADHALGISASDANNNLASFSDFGKYVSLGAPGVSILSTIPTYSVTLGCCNYGYLSGTSMATPFVSALAGLLAASTPNTTAAAIIQRMEQTAASSVTGGAWGQSFGYGIINAGAAVGGTNRSTTTGGATGQIVDAYNNPISGAVVSIGGLNFTTDSTGLYWIRPLAAGSYPVSVSASGFATQTVSVTVAPGADSIFPVTLGITYGNFTGTVSNLGLGVANAIVQAVSGGLIVGTAVADSAGNYTLWVPGGSGYTVQASKIDSATTSISSLSVTAGGSTVVNLNLPQSLGTVSGTVQSTSSAPLAGAQVTITSSSFSESTITGANGSYMLTAIPAGSYSVTAQDSGYNPATSNGVTVSQNGTTPLNFQLVAQATGTAAFIKSDATTQGTWKGVYGADGFNVIGDTASYPSYVTVTPASNSSYLWVSSSSDPRALQKASSTTDRVAACWFSGTSFTIDLSFNDTNMHQVALYLLDWDNYMGRTERVDILDTSGNVLDTRSVASFTNGQYLVWNLSNHVVIRLTNLNAPSNAVMSGLFFGPASTTAPSSSAAFVTTDTTTEGSWKAVYGGDGANVIGDTASYPSYVTVTPAGNSMYTWASSTTDPRAPQLVSSSSGRVAACWFSAASFTIDLNFTDTNTHLTALYLLDWDSYFGRTERVDILNTSGTVLDTRSMSSFVSGQYLVWNLSGHVVIRITNTNPGSNAVVSGLFFGQPHSATAAFVKSDTTTAGTWKGVYGSAGGNVIGDTAIYPAYATVTPSGNSYYLWASPTTDPRAPQLESSSSGRVAACWFSSGSFTIDVKFSDTNPHQVSLYLLDWDNYFGRAERVDILDASGNVLDTRNAAGFVGGQYLVWNLTGHVVIRVTNTNASSNAVVSGLFFQ